MNQNYRANRHQRFISWIASILLVISSCIPTVVSAEDLPNQLAAPIVSDEEIADTSSLNSPAVPAQEIENPVLLNEEQTPSHVVKTGDKSFYLTLRRPFTAEGEIINLDENRQGEITIETNEKNSVAKKYYIKVHDTNIPSINQGLHQGKQVQFKVDDTFVTDNRPQKISPAFTAARHTNNIKKEMFFTPKEEATATLVVTVPEMEDKPVTIKVNIVDPNKPKEKKAKLQQEIDGAWTDIQGDLLISAPYEKSYKIKAVMEDGSEEPIEAWEAYSEDDVIEMLSKEDDSIFEFKPLNPGRVIVEAYFENENVKGSKSVNIVVKSPEVEKPEITLKSKSGDNEWGNLIQPWVIEKEGNILYSLEAAVPDGTNGEYRWQVTSGNDEIIKARTIKDNLFVFRALKPGTASIQVYLKNNDEIDAKTVYVEVKEKDAPSIKLSQQVGEELKALNDDLELKYDFGEKVYTLKAKAPNNEPITWQVPYSAAKGITEQKGSKDDEFRFRIKAMGEHKIIVYAGKPGSPNRLSKEFTINVVKAEAPKLQYKLSENSPWVPMDNTPIALVKGRPESYIMIDNGERWGLKAAQDGIVEISPFGYSGLWKIKPLANGNVELTATSASGEKHTFTVAVSDLPATDVVIHAPKTTLYVSQSMKLRADITPINHTDSLSWKVDKPELASIDQSGNLKALAAGVVKVTATAGNISKSVDITIKSSAEVKIYFQYKDGTKQYTDDSDTITLTVLDEGGFYIEGEDAVATHWHAREKHYFSHNEFLIHFWIDQFNRYFPRTAATKDATVTYTQDGQTLKKDFHIKVVSSDVEEIKVFAKDRELSMDDPIIVQGSEWTHVTVKGRNKGSQEFVTLPETSYFIEYKYNQHIIGSSFSLWAPETFVVTVRMKDDNDVKSDFKATSKYVPVSSLVGDIPQRWEIHEWNKLQEKYIGIRYDSTLDKGYTLRVGPEHASDWKLNWEALTPEIAEYDPLHSNGIVPKKPGLAKFRVSSVDNPKITKEVEVEFFYRTPLEAATTVPDKILNTGEIKDFDIQVQPAHASEQRFHWTYSQDGIVSVKDIVNIDPENLNVPKWTTHTIRAIKPGTVTVTGTPYDQTNQVEPITFTVTVSGKPADNSIIDLAALNQWANEAITQITKQYTVQASTDPWVISELSKLDQSITKEQQDAIFSVIFNNGVLVDDVKALSKGIISLRAAGLDPEKYHGYNLLQELIDLNKTDDLYEMTSYLWALSTDDYEMASVKTEIDNTVQKLLSMQQTDGLWKDSYGGWADATGFALYALAPYKDQPAVRSAIEKAVDGLSLQQEANGGFSDNSNSLAMIVGGLLSSDKEYLSDVRLIKNGKTMLHALQDYQTENSGFKWKADETGSNGFATEQSYRALIAYTRGYVFSYRGKEKNAIEPNDKSLAESVLKSEVSKADAILGKASQYDEAQINQLSRLVQQAKNLLENKSSSIADINNQTRQISELLKALKPKNSGGGAGGSAGDAPSDITVTFTLESIERGGTAKEVWLNQRSYTVPKDSNVAYVFDKALKENNLAYDNPSGNYVKSILSPKDGRWFGEFSNGQNSGWMYKVNGVRPNVGLAQYRLNDRDDIVWFYTNDYTKEPGYNFGGGGGSSAPSDTTTIAENAAPLAQSPTAQENNAVTFTDVPTDKWYSKAVQSMVQKGLAKGREHNRFEPDATITRAEFVAILARIDGKSIEDQSTEQFKDIKATDWYYRSIAWANANQIASGNGRLFEPNRPITREEMAAMLLSYTRYNNGVKLSSKNNVIAFADDAQISTWAKESVQAMQSAGIIGGKENNRFAPKAHATRAETMEMLFRLLGE